MQTNVGHKGAYALRKDSPRLFSAQLAAKDLRDYYPFRPVHKSTYIPRILGVVEPHRARLTLLQVQSFTAPFYPQLIGLAPHATIFNFGTFHSGCAFAMPSKLLTMGSGRISTSGQGKSISEGRDDGPSMAMCPCPVLMSCLSWSVMILKIMCNSSRFLNINNPLSPNSNLRSHSFFHRDHQALHPMLNSRTLYIPEGRLPEVLPAQGQIKLS